MHLVTSERACEQLSYKHVITAVGCAHGTLRVYQQMLPSLQ